METLAAAQAVTVTTAVRSRMCRLCWALPGTPCSVSGPPSDHLRRWLSAEDAGLVSRADMNAVVAALTVVADHVLIPAAAADWPLAGWAHQVERVAELGRQAWVTASPDGAS